MSDAPGQLSIDNHSDALLEIYEAKEALDELNRLTPEGCSDISNGFLLNMVTKRMDKAISEFLKHSRSE